MGSKQRHFVLLYWKGWQQVHENLVKQTEVSPTVLPAGGSRVTYRRRAVNFPVSYTHLTLPTIYSV